MGDDNLRIKCCTSISYSTVTLQQRILGAYSQKRWGTFAIAIVDVLCGRVWYWGEVKLRNKLHEFTTIVLREYWEKKNQFVSYSRPDSYTDNNCDFLHKSEPCANTDHQMRSPVIVQEDRPWDNHKNMFCGSR